MTTKYELRQVTPDYQITHSTSDNAGDVLHDLSETFTPGEYVMVKIEETVIARRVVGKHNQRFVDRLGEVFLRRMND